MQNIRVYRILWKNILAAIICLAFAVSGIVFLFQGKGNTWGLTGGLLFFGISGVFLLYLTLKVRLRPYLTITDRCLVLTRVESSLKDYTIDFSVVDHFELTPFHILLPLKRDLCVYYKKDKDKQKVFSPTLLGSIASKLFSGPDEYIAVDGINMKPQELCDLLNEQVNKVR